MTLKIFCINSRNIGSSSLRLICDLRQPLHAPIIALYFISWTVPLNGTVVQVLAQFIPAPSHRFYHFMQFSD